MAFVGRLQNLDLSRSCYPSYGAPTFTPVGLSPTGRASLRWTHNDRYQEILDSALETGPGRLRPLGKVNCHVNRAPLNEYLYGDFQRGVGVKCTGDVCCLL